MKLSLKSKIIIFLAGTIFLFNTISAYIFLSAHIKSKYNELIAKGTTLSYALSVYAGDGLIKENLDIIQNASYIARSEDVKSTLVYTNLWDPVDAYPIDELHSQPHPDVIEHFKNSISPTFVQLEDSFEFYSPITFLLSPNSSPSVIGFAKIVFSSQPIKKDIEELLLIGIIIALSITFCVIVAIHLLVDRLVLTPISNLHKYIATLKTDNIPDVEIEKRITNTNTIELDTIGEIVIDTFKELHNKNKQYQTLYQIAIRAHECLSIDELLILIIEKSCQLINADLAAIAIYNHNGQFTKLILKGTTIKMKDSLPEGRGLLNFIYQTEKPVRIDDVLKHPAFSGSFPESHPIIRNLLVYPIYSSKNIKIGAFLFANKSDGFADEDENILKAISAEAAIAIDRAEGIIQLQRFQKVIDSAFDLVIVANDKGYIIYVNPAFLTLTGYSEQEVIDKRLTILKSGYHDADFYKNMWDTIRSGQVWKGEVVNKKKNGETYIASAIIFPIHSEGTFHYASILRDITQEKKLYEQLLRAQKMEAIGTLAGGIAHDFNNILTAILGYSDIMLTMLKEGDKFYKPTTIIYNAAQKGAELAKKILSVTRKEKIQASPIDINEIIHNSIELLTRSIPKNIEFVLKLNSNIPKIMADPSQIQQVILNLTVNARDAMPNGGKLTIATDVVDKDYVFADGFIDTRANNYIKLSISDTGIGIDREIQRKIFDPFFTTKETGKGTGLGLYIVHSVVTNHEGYLNLYSEPNKGTKFNIYLPVTEIVQTMQSNEILDIKGTETILMIDDEADIRELFQDQMQILGYNILLAGNAVEGIKIFNDMKDKISLVVVDMIMPDMEGSQVFYKLKEIKPDVKVVLCSGYNHEGLEGVDKLLKEGVKGFVQKPFTQRTIAQKIREILSQ